MQRTNHAVGDQIFFMVAERPPAFGVLQLRRKFDHNSLNREAARPRNWECLREPAHHSTAAATLKMKFLTLILLLLTSCFSVAQSFPRYELSAGYSYGTPDDLTTPFTSNQFSPRGWNGSFATNLKRWVGVEVDGGGQYINTSVLFGGVPYSL